MIAELDFRRSRCSFDFFDHTGVRPVNLPAYFWSALKIRDAWRKKRGPEE